MPIIKFTGAVVGVIAAGAYLRHSTVPVVAAYRVGRDFERLAADPARYVPAFRVGYKFGRADRAR